MLYWKLTMLRPVSWTSLRLVCRKFATVSSSAINRYPTSKPAAELLEGSVPSQLDRSILSAVQSGRYPLSGLIRDYLDNVGTVLDASLAYESRPSPSRSLSSRTSESSRNPLVLVAHCVRDGNNHKLTLCSGFALKVSSQREGEAYVLTCAHTFEEIRHSPLMFNTTSKMEDLLPVELQSCQSGTFVITGDEQSIKTHPVTAISSALPRSDLILLSCTTPSVPTVPVSPYPVHPQTPIRAHFVSHVKPKEPGWSSWIGGTWSKWPGTYDALNHMLFRPLPTAGSSGGPIIDEESGAVVGVMLGTRMDNRIEGLRGWGVPSETIFEVKMFSLPGLEGKK
ncbi:hypothetical protein D9758_002379 [Tetrapyrgos nigripes]|uniref:Trypsin-like peptidase domain-containing protein n=1 Tax=Tetrapyrgos nigripes TaxID=182062 RepID=A0A8H5GP87_9AGAR|nr:hypothetical protein D9758_002379 [Tetrapyrgos nigripes]